MKKKDLKFKVGFCQNKYLKGVFGDKNDGHYVVIRNVNDDGTCDVNVITSLESRNKEFTPSKVAHLKKGNTYSIPFYEANFTRWSGVNTSLIKGVELKNIVDIGKKSIKRKHYFYIGKFCNKKSGSKTSTKASYF